MPTIPLFVSSTFRDFHAERDTIRDVVVPQLSRELRPLGCRIELIDLRSGVEGGESLTETEANLRILDVCAQEIERAHPFFVVLVGTRGGWEPRREVIDGILVPRGLEGEHGMTVTDVEVMLASQSKLTDAPLLAFFRRDDPTFPEDWRENLGAARILRERIRLEQRFIPSDYSATRTSTGKMDLREFERLLHGALQPAVMRHARALVTSDDPIGRATSLFRETRRPFVRPYASTATRVLHHLDSHKSVCLYGEPGVGTSTAWCAVLEMAEPRNEVRSVALDGSGINPDITAILRTLLNGAGTDLEEELADHVDISSLFTLGATAEPRLGSMLTRNRLHRDLMLAAFDADPPVILAVDDVESAFSDRDRQAVLDSSARPDHARWLVTTSDMSVRNELSAAGFTIMDIAPLEQPQVIEALDESVRFYAPGRGLPSEAVRALSDSARSAAWVEASSRVLLRPPREELDEFPAGEGWLAAFNRRLVEVARTMEPGVHELRMASMRRAEESIGSGAFVRMLTLLESSIFGLERDVVAQCLNLPTLEVTRVADMLEPIILARRDGRLVLREPDLSAVFTRNVAADDLVVFHTAAAEALERAGGADALSHLERTWQLHQARRDVGPALRDLAQVVFSPGSWVDNAALGHLADIFWRATRIGPAPVVTGIDDQIARLLTRSAGWLLKRSGAATSLEPIREMVASDTVGVSAKQLTASMGARIAMARFIATRDVKHVSVVRDFVESLSGSESISILSDWELEELAWGTNTLASFALRSNNVRYITHLLSLSEACHKELISRSTGVVRDTAIYELSYLRRNFAEDARRVENGLGRPLLDGALQDLDHLVKARPEDLSPLRLLIDTLLENRDPSDATNKERLARAVKMLMLLRDARPGETEWIEHLADAREMQCQVELRSLDRSLGDALSAAESAVEFRRLLHSILPTAPEERAYLAVAIALRVEVSQAIGEDPATATLSRLAIHEAQDLLLASRRPESREFDVRRADAEHSSAVARAMLEQNPAGAHQLFGIAEVDYRAAAKIWDGQNQQGKIAVTLSNKAMAALLVAKRILGEAGDPTQAEKWLKEARDTSRSGIAIINRLLRAEQLIGDPPRYRQKLLITSADACLTSVENGMHLSRSEIMRTAEMLESVAESLRFGNDGERRPEIHLIVSELLRRLLSLDVGSPPVGPAKRREIWEDHRRVLSQTAPPMARWAWDRSGRQE